MLVEEPRVEVEDPLADDVEAEVPGLDHARVDRADRHLVWVAALHGHHPGCGVGIVFDERSQRLVAVEAHAVQIVRLTFVPVRRGDEVDIDGIPSATGSTVSRRTFPPGFASAMRTGPPCVTAYSPANDHPPSSASPSRSR